MGEYSAYSVRIANGNNDPGGVENLRAALESQFPGLSVEVLESPNDPSGIILGGPDGPGPETRILIQRWVERNRENYC